MTRSRKELSASSCDNAANSVRPKLLWVCRVEGSVKCMLYSDINIENDCSLLLGHLISVTILRSMLRGILRLLGPTICQ